MTKTAKLILKILHHNTALSATEIMAEIPNADKVTIYRNLTKLVNANLLREVNLKKGIVSYELNLENHTHFICQKCEKIEHLHLKDSVLEKLIPRNHKTNNIEINIKGFCSDCN